MGRYPRIRSTSDQWLPVPELEKQDLSRKTALVVGANTGLGLEVAKHLARMRPARLALACRSLEKGEDAAKAIKEATGFDRTAVYTVDLSVFSSVNDFVAKFDKEEEQLHILVYNAGVALMNYRSTADGFEETIQVNDMSCALICVGLLPLMLKTSESIPSASCRPRITIVSSRVHCWTQPTPEELSEPNYLAKINDAEHCSNKLVMLQRYQTSKLINVLFTRELAARVAASKVVVNCVSPGFCYSNLLRHAAGLQFIGLWIFRLFMAHSTEVGGRQIAFAAVARPHCDYLFHGKYVSDMEVKEESDWCLTPEGFATQRRIWDETVSLLGGVSPKFKEVVELYLK